LAGNLAERGTGDLVSFEGSCWKCGRT